jgi:hypothetical protein
MVFRYESKWNSEIRVTYGIFLFGINYKGHSLYYYIEISILTGSVGTF